ncbi:uncharacterized protein Gasu_33550 [Galdieria sulphuraria]|uniref:Uncharacterized protein n=1 Tax=Galdieria sulphuraria TaxID=130081 RepID=M2XGG8_GALSU|nr:uncharacterized protein Gasu_33550 [Galdieria sulphuraria]EME29152.1 hypothetical protein Gasu_33550 [Galdieria sulphuraria]|eukprot:XP_005705672.1 hypothetical protein Gasu_33550 [Galdieria sulphuraria]
MLRLGRGEYFFRPLFYFTALFIFFQVTRLQFFTSPTHKKQRRFGGKLIFLTVQTNLILFAYTLLALATSCLKAFLPDNNKYSWFNRLEKFCYQTSGLAFPSGAFMGLGYYTLIHFHKEVRKVAHQVKHFDKLMHLLHGFPLLYVFLDSFFLDPSVIEKYRQSFWMEASWSLGFAFFYFCWTFLCAYLNDWNWPYPFQHELSAFKQVVFYSMVFAIVPMLVWLGRNIRGSLHWKSWKESKDKSHDAVKIE